MRAVLMERGRIWVEQVEDPIPGPGEVLVKSLACGICGSDLHAAMHTEDFVATSREAGGAFKLLTFDPVVLGHEFVAEVVDYGPNSQRTLGTGSLVCSVPVLLRETNLPVGYSHQTPGGFAQYMLLSERLLAPVPQGTPVSAAALTEPMAVGLHAVNKAHLSGNEAILVLGCGPVGLAVITALKARGAGPIVAADYSPGRRHFAEQQGADWVVDPEQGNAFTAIDLKQHTDVVVFECVGVPGMLDNIFLNSPRNARIVVVGVCLQIDHARPLIAINKELSVQYVLGYSLDEFSETLELIADGHFDVGGLVTGQVALEGVAEAFRELASPKHHAKILVEPW
ncbi:MAG: zinc-binding dehydrogenase [Gammaproteobacteria bacterium]|nr:zinc-binding dehydrogenase [Gammaproteobacteria bacterium]